MSKTLRQISIQVNPVVSSGTTTLSQAAASLSPGSSVAFPIDTWGLTSDWTGEIISWCTRWHWDPVNLKGYLMCKEAENTGDGNHKLIVYTESTNSFAKVYDNRLSTGGAAGSGHGYDCGAIDTTNGEFYFLPYLAENVIKWDGSSGWTVATGNVGGSTSNESTGPRGLSFNPNLYGTGDKGLVQPRGLNFRAWRHSTGSSGTWPAIGASPYSSVRYSQSVYCSALGATIASCGDAGLRAMRVDDGIPTNSPNPIASPMPNDFPVTCSSNASTGASAMNRLLPTPSGSVAVFESANPGRVWKLNTTTLEWDLQAFVHPLVLDGTSWPTMYLSTYQMYWTLRQRSNGTLRPDSILWKPPTGF